MYFTDASSDFSVHCVANPSGRLIHYSRATGKLTSLIDKLWFANGVALSPNEDFILVSDMGRYRIMKYWLKGDKRGQSEIFAEGIPGTPDNLTPDKNGVWVALPVATDPDHPYLPLAMSPLPWARKFIARIFSLIELLFDSIDRIYPNDLSKGIMFKLGQISSPSQRSTIMRFDWEGKIIAAYHAFDNSVYSHVMELDGNLYLGSFSNLYIAKVVRRAHL